MATDQTVITVSAGDIPQISGLIEALTDVADHATRSVDSWETGNSLLAFEDTLGELKDSLLKLNDYVDEHFEDE